MNSPATVSEELLRLATLAGVQPTSVRHQLLAVPDTTLTTGAAVVLTDLLSIQIEESRCLLITSIDVQTWPEDGSGPVLDKKRDGFYYEDFGLFFTHAGVDQGKAGTDWRFLTGEVFFVFGPGKLEFSIRVPLDLSARKMHIAVRFNTFQLPAQSCERLARMATIRGN